MTEDNHEPTARASPRGLVWRKPECKRCEATDRNRIQGRGRRGELAHDSKAHWYGAHGKCGACALTVRVLTWGDLHRERCDWMAAKPGRFHRDTKDQAPWRAARRVSKNRQQPLSGRTARRAATRSVTAQKSADAVVGGQQQSGPPKG